MKRVSQFFKGKTFLLYIYIFKIIIVIIKNCDIYIKNDKYHNYETINLLEMIVTQHNTSRFEKARYYSGIKLYNHLSDFMKIEEIFIFFSKKQKQKKGYYSVKEFLEHEMSRFDIN